MWHPMECHQTGSGGAVTGRDSTVVGKDRADPSRLTLVANVARWQIPQT